MQRKKGQLICCMQEKAQLSFYNVATGVGIEIAIEIPIKTAINYEVNAVIDVAIEIAIKTAINYAVNAPIDVAISVEIKIAIKIAINFRKHYKGEAQPF